MIERDDHDTDSFAFKKIYAEDNFNIERVKKVQARILKFDPKIKLEDFGFGASSGKMIYHHAHVEGKEKSEPDNKITGTNILIEITGTPNISKFADIFINVNKVLWADNHPEYECYWAHHIDSLDLLRFGRMIGGNRFAIIPLKIHNKDWSIQTKMDMRAIPYNHDSVMTSLDFKTWLKNDKRITGLS